MDKPWKVACRQVLPQGRLIGRLAIVGSWMGKVSGGSWIPSGKTEDQSAIGNV